MTAEEAIDRAVLTDLVVRYCRGIDRRDWGLIRSLYWDDAIDHHGAMFEGGPDALVEWLPTILAGYEVTVHGISNSLIVLAGDVAEGEHHATAYHRTHPPGRREIMIAGRYLDRYERRGGVWKFSERRLAFDHGESRALDEPAWAELSAQAPLGTCDRSDPSWALALLAGLE